MATVCGLVDQQSSGAVVVPYQDVDVAVIVDIAKGCTAAYLGECERRARAITGFLEPATAQIVEEQLPLMQWQRILGLPERLDDLHCPVHRQQVEPSVVVEVEPRSAEPGEGHAC